MAKITDDGILLKLQALMALYWNDDRERNVSAIAQTLNVPKYKVSRLLTALETEGLVDKSIDRHPRLTELGWQKAEEYQKKISISVNHLLFEGVDEEHAKRDAFFWALHTTDETMRILEAANERYRIKNELRGEKKFSGNILCKLMHEGDYEFSFIFYRLDPEDGSVLSMANHGFENPCRLIVRGGKGTVQLKAVPMLAGSAVDGHMMAGEVSDVQYFDGEKYCNTARRGEYISFPAQALEFVNCGTGVGQFMTGTVKIKMQCSVGPMHMPESTALFTLTI